MMKNIVSGLFTIFLLILLGCDEVPPVVNPIENQGDCTPASDALVENQQRQVLIEEFTGVGCVNCPAGSVLIEELLDQYGEQLIAVSIHEGIFSRPNPQSQYDFRTDDGTQVSQLIGGIQGWPAASVNRVLGEGASEIAVGSSEWAKLIADELAIEPRVKLNIEHSFEEASRDLFVEITIYPQENIEEDVRLSLYLIENDIKDYQLTPDGDDLDYSHKHVFRDAITNPEGNTIQEDLNTRTRVCKSYTATVSSEFNLDNCSLIAFVHLGGADKNILQAVQVKLQK